MTIYSVRCVICGEEALRTEDHNYYDFFMHMFGDFGWELTQDKDGNLKPICENCITTISNLSREDL